MRIISSSLVYSGPPAGRLFMRESSWNLEGGALLTVTVLTWNDPHERSEEVDVVGGEADLLGVEHDILRLAGLGETLDHLDGGQDDDDELERRGDLVVVHGQSEGRVRGLKQGVA